MTDLKNQLKQAELNFVRKLGQIKYLNHLKKNQTVEDCPICNSPPETKVCVCVCSIIHSIHVKNSINRLR